MLLYASTYILGTSRKRRKTSMMGARFQCCCELLSATLPKRNFYHELFPINLPKFTTNEKTLQQLLLQVLRLVSAKLYTNALKFQLLRRLLPVHGCNLALLGDNCNA